MAEDFWISGSWHQFFFSLPGNRSDFSDRKVKPPSREAVTSPPSDLKATLQRAGSQAAGGSQVSAFLAECFHHFECGGHQYSWPIWLRPENLRDAQVTWPKMVFRLVISLWFLSKQDCVVYITKPKHLDSEKRWVYFEVIDNEMGACWRKTRLDTAGFKGLKVTIVTIIWGSSLKHGRFGQIIVI